MVDSGRRLNGRQMWLAFGLLWWLGAQGYRLASPPAPPVAPGWTVAVSSAVAVILFWRMGDLHLVPAPSPEQAMWLRRLRGAAITGMVLSILWSLSGLLQVGEIAVPGWWQRLLGVPGVLFFWLLAFVRAGARDRDHADTPASALVVAASLAQAAVALAVLARWGVIAAAVLAGPALRSPGSLRLLLVVAWHAGLLAAAMLVRRRVPWARQFLLANGVAQVALALDMVVLRFHPLVAWGELSSGWGLNAWIAAASLLVAVGVSAVLLRPAIAAEFAAPNPIVGWGAMLAAIGYALVFFRPPPPAVETAAPEPPPPVIEPGIARFTLRPLYDGHPIAELAEQPTAAYLVGLRGSGRPFTTARIRNGVIELSPVPTGTYWLNVVIDADAGVDLGPMTAGMPGDLLSRGRATLVAVKAGEQPAVDVPFTRIVRLRIPEDTGPGLPWAVGEHIHLHAPVRFRWDAVPEVERYDVAVHVISNGDGRSARETAQATLQDTEWTIDLPPSVPGESYQFTIHAFGRASEVGELQIQGVGWYAWEYRFDVVSPSSGAQ